MEHGDLLNPMMLRGYLNAASREKNPLLLHAALEFVRTGKAMYYFAHNLDFLSSQFCLLPPWPSSKSSLLTQPKCLSSTPSKEVKDNNNALK